MKRLFILALLSAIFFSANSQTIYSANFSSGLSLWTPVTNVGGGARTWHRITNPFTIPSSGGSWTFGSSTAGNGYAIFVSDSSVNTNHADDASMMSPVINCTGHNNIFLSFDQYFSYYNNGLGTVSVSTDNVNWNPVCQAVGTSVTNPEHIQVDISTWAANQATVYLKFNYQGSWDGFWAVDDIKINAPASVDISVDTVTLNKYVGIGNNTIAGTVSNQGVQTITSFDLYYTIDGGTQVYQSYNGLNIPAFGTYNFSFTQAANISTATTHTIAVTASGPNGGNDGNLVNNTASETILALSALPDKNVLIEEFTTAVCQYCPRGTTTMNTILANDNPDPAHPRIIGVALHAGFYSDAMTTADHTTIASTYTNAAPTGMVDRVFFPGETQVATSDGVWETNALSRENLVVPMSIIADNTYNSSTRQLTVHASAKFYSAVSGDFRINCYIQEDSVSGSGSGYNQVNAYNTVNTSEWYNRGNPIVGFKHRHVNRKMLGGPWGNTGTIPATTTDGVVYTKTYNDSIKYAWNASRVKLVILVQHGNNSNKNDRNILNAMELELNSSDSTAATPYTITGINEPVATAGNLFSLSPNPASDYVNLTYTIADNATISMEVYNILGQIVTAKTAQSLSKGDYRTQLNTTNFGNGVYFISIKDSGKVIQTLKFVVSK